MDADPSKDVDFTTFDPKSPKRKRQPFSIIPLGQLELLRKVIPFKDSESTALLPLKTPESVLNTMENYSSTTTWRRTPGSLDLPVFPARPYTTWIERSLEITWCIYEQLLAKPLVRSWPSRTCTSWWEMTIKWTIRGFWMRRREAIKLILALWAAHSIPNLSLVKMFCQK
jgi:hypothetical protein